MVQSVVRLTWYMLDMSSNHNKGFRCLLEYNTLPSLLTQYTVWKTDIYVTKASLLDKFQTNCNQKRSTLGYINFNYYVKHSS